MDITNRFRRERAKHKTEEAHGVGVAHVVESSEWGEPNSNSFQPEDVTHSLQHFEKQARAVFERTSVAIGASVRVIPQKLIEQIAVCCVKLDAIEAGRQSITRRIVVLRDQRRNLVEM